MNNKYINPLTDFGLKKILGEAVFDIYCKNQNGEKFAAEMQKNRHHSFKDRNIYYSAFSIREQAKSGKAWRYSLKAILTAGYLNDRHE